MIRTHDIKKVLGGRKVLDGVNFTAERKKITYLFGALRAEPGRRLIRRNF